jgi:acid phosphatase
MLRQRLEIFYKSRPLQASSPGTAVAFMALLALVLLGLSVVLADAEVTLIKQRGAGWEWYVFLIAVGAAAGCFALAAIEAIDVDRLVGARRYEILGRARTSLARGAAALLLAGICWVVMEAVVAGGAGSHPTPLSRIKHIVVIYEENHSFDNLYGGWDGVNGLQNADAAHTTQIDQKGRPYVCLRQNDVNLVRLPKTCKDFPNTWWTIDARIRKSAKTCPPILKAFEFPFGVPKGKGRKGGCTRDLVHGFYQSQYQLNGGAQNRYATGSDSAGMAMGVYDTKALPIYTYLHSDGHPDYAIADEFFQAAFGGSFLNHQWLIAAATPTVPRARADGSDADRHSVVDAHGMVATRKLDRIWRLAKYPLYRSPSPSEIEDREWTVKCGSTSLPVACGDYAVNTSQPAYPPSGTHGAKLPPQTNPTIGDRLNDAGIDWAWYSGGWANADGDTTDPGYTNGRGPTCSDPNVDPSPGIAMYPRCPSNLFQYHHQPFNYFKAFDPSPKGLDNRRKHLQDEMDFTEAADASGSSCQLKAVSFVKPFGPDNEHPGYSSVFYRDWKLVTLLKKIEESDCRKDTMVIVTYDEFGGQWDHVPPPGQAGGPAGPHDQWGPGLRVPALVISPFLRGSFVVDDTEHDTTSILATIEHRFHLAPMAWRDRHANDLSSVFRAT